MEYEQVKYDSEISSGIIDGFSPLDYTFDMLDYEFIYKNILSSLPPNSILFDSFGLEKLIACETICAAICHQINWDYLRQVVYNKTMFNPEWVDVEYLASIKASEIRNLFIDYEKKERVQEYDRSKMIRTIANHLKKSRMSFSDIFMKNGIARDYIDIESFFLSCNVFSKDPQHKKFQLLIQTLSDYSCFEYLSNYYKPTIDYHLIRLFLRRGIVRPHNKFAYQYILNQDTIRKENTIATLRSVCSKSLEELCWITSLNLKEVNRIEWWVGRSICTNDCPDCELEREDAKWLKKQFNNCPYYDTCYARNHDKNLLNINEPKYTGNSY